MRKLDYDGNASAISSTPKRRPTENKKKIFIKPVKKLDFIH